jgi:hypothetical protein
VLRLRHTLAMLRAAVVVLFVATAVLAQTPPPSALPPAPEDLPNGRPVSRPIQPSERERRDPSADPGIDWWAYFNPLAIFFPDRATFDPPAETPFQTWMTADFMLGWGKRSDLPVLATSNSLAAPALAHPATRVVLGGGPTPLSELGAVRLAAGWWADQARTLGFEASVRTFGTRTATVGVSGGGEGQPLLARPLVNARTGREDLVYIAHPLMLGQLDLSHSLRVDGWEALTLLNLYTGHAVFVHGLAGYRFLLANEGLRFEQRSEYARLTGQGAEAVTYRSASADQIDAHNHFHGGLFGVRTQFDAAGLFVQLDAKVSLGQTTQTVTVSGRTVATADFPTGTQTSDFPYAVFGQVSNTGRQTRRRFAVLPEVGLKVGGQFTPRAWWHVGYSFTYLSDVVRAADQLDRVVDLAQTAGGVGDRPRVPFARSDFWTQGVTVGLEWRY